MEYTGRPSLTHVVTYQGNYRVNGANNDRRPDKKNCGESKYVFNYFF
jgi:hypothetical protein